MMYHILRGQYDYFDTTANRQKRTIWDKQLAN